MIRKLTISACLLVVGSWLCAMSGCGGDGLDAATEHMVAAREAVGQGDNAKAIEEYSAALAIRPDFWAYFERAKLYSDLGDDAAAKTDCEKALEITPDSEDVKWLLKELEKPSAQRFQAAPPSHSK